MDVDPVLHIHTQASFCVSIHTEGQNTDKQIHWNCFTGIPVHDVQFVSGPVHLNPVTGLSGNVHGGTLPLCELLEVEAELGIHEGLFAQLAALLAVLHPEQLECHTAASQFLGYLLKVRHPAQGNLLLLLWEQQPFQICIRIHIQRPSEIGCAGPQQDSSNGISGTPTALCNAPLTDPLTVKPEDLMIFGHTTTSL